MSFHFLTIVPAIIAQIPSIPTNIYPYIGAIALVLGLLLAFFGESIFKLLTSLIGALIGGLIGYSFGIVLGGLIGGIFVALIGAVIGGLLFYFVAEAGIALVLAYFTFLGVLYLFGVGGGISTLRSSLGIAEIAGLIAGFAVFMIAIIFFEDIVAIVTAVAGGLLVDYALTVFNLGTLGTIISVVVIVIGLVYQFSRIRSKRLLNGVAKSQSGNSGF